MSKDASSIISIIGTITLVAVAVAFAVFVIATVSHRSAAIEAGHAEYYLDDDNAKQWRWLPPCTDKDKHDTPGDADAA